jgi:osmotically-inducible protein OsmY
VHNALLVDVAEALEDLGTSRQIEQELERTVEVDPAQVDVAVAGETAVLSGEVESLEEAARSEQIAGRYRRRVRNELHVEDASDHPVDADDADPA